MRASDSCFRGLQPAGAVLLFVVGLACVPGAAQAPRASDLARMPVREVTVFKDGHAFVLHRGGVPTDAAGNVLLDDLPTPVLGTFWPYSADPDVKLRAVVASQRRVTAERAALTLRELLEGNVGQPVSVTEVGGAKYEATVAGFPTRPAEETPQTGDLLPQKGELVLLKTARGVKAVPVARIQDVTFRTAPRPRVPEEEIRNLLTLRLDWAGRKPERAADVGMMYVQKGLRWIPGYRVTLDGAGNAVVKLQATLINELADLEDVTANLVIGVPTFAFEGTPDPINFQQTVAQLGVYFDQRAQTGTALSSAMMSQAEYRGAFGGLAGRGPAAPPPPRDLGPEVSGAEKSEDLFVFTVQRVTLRKGQRMVLPVAEYRLKYRDVFTLDLPFGPPPELRGNLNTEQLDAITRALARPRVMHQVRMRNEGPHPLTTAPALIVRGERVLAQGMMTYTPAGAEANLEITPAVDIRVRREEKEVKRTPNALVHQGNQITRVDMAGTISLRNLRGQPVELEVTRFVLGNAGSADHDGRAEMINVFEESGTATTRPGWWNAYSWPHWWHRLNGLGRFRWDVKLGPGESVDLGYTWHYFAP